MNATQTTTFTFTLYLGCKTTHEQTVLDASRDSYVDRFRSTHEAKLAVSSLDQAQQIVRAYLGEACVAGGDSLLRFYYRDEAAKRADYYQDDYEACLVIEPVVEAADASEFPF